MNPLTWEDISRAPIKELRDYLRGLLVTLKPPGLLHPHGFHVFLLHKDATAQWRIHIWPTGTRMITGMPAFIHTHDHNVRSRVLRGRLTNIQYEVALSNNLGAPLYQVEYLGSKYSAASPNILAKTSDRVIAKEISRAAIEEGMEYSVAPHMFHEAVIPSDILTCTFVCMSDIQPGPVKVIGVDGYADRITFERQESLVTASAVL